MSWNDVLGVIGSLASIIGLPIAIKQIVSLKKQIEHTKTALNRLADRNVAEKINKTYEVVAGIAKQMLQIHDNLSKPGFDIKGKSTKGKYAQIKLKLNECMCELPSDKKEISEKLAELIRLIATNPSSSETIMELYEKTNVLLVLLKEQQAQYISAEIDILAKTQ